jgi:hypothetical protein
MVVLIASGLLIPTLVFAQEASVDGSATAIRKVIAGKTCVGDDVLVFKETGKFERTGSPNGAYSVGYGTILIRRGQDVHGHLTSVSVRDQLLHMSTSTYQCGG